MTEAKTKEVTGGRLVLVLFLIAAITALLLGLTNYVTHDRIEAIKAEKTASAMQEVLPSDGYEPIAYAGADSRILGVQKASSGGYIVSVKVPGSQDMIEMLVGVDAAGKVSGVAIVEMAETAGLGAKAEDAAWRAQFVGAEAPVAVDKDGGEIDALTGATVTSRAVADGVNAALGAVAALH